MRRSSTWSLVLYGMGVLVIVAAGVLLATQLTTDATTRGSGAFVAASICYTVFALALASGLFALGAFIRRNRDLGPVLEEHFHRAHMQVAEVRAQVHDFAYQLERLRPGAPVTQPTIDPQQFQYLLELVKDIRQLSMLPDEVRRELLDREAEERRGVHLTQFKNFLDQQQWGQADRVLSQLEREYPNDAKLATLRRQLNASRKQSEPNAVLSRRQQIEEMIALSSFEDAYQSARQLVLDFPDNAEGRDLLARIERDRDVHRETNGMRMYEEIKHDIDRRMWSRALLHAERMLEQFPDHRRAEEIRGKLRTIRENAEIQERQEIEVRIQELLRAGQFQEAVDLGEELLQKYPLSPQAEAMEQLLPRIKQRLEDERLAPGAQHSTGAR